MQITTISVIIPVYNERGAIAQTLTEVVQALEAVEDLEDWEIIVVDDGSSDGCCEFLDSKSRSPDTPASAKLIQHETNKGYGAALKSGIRAGRHESILIIDADGTYPASSIPILLERLKAADMVVGSRTGDNVRYSKFRMLPKVFLKLFAEWVAGRAIPDLNSGLRVFRKSAVEQFQQILPNGFSFTTTLTLAMLHNNLRVFFEPINYAERIGNSKFRPFRDTWIFCVTVLRLGVLFAPLKVFLPIAMIFLMLGLYTLAGDVFVRNDLTDRTVIFLFGASQLGILALLADMISRK